MFRIIVLSARTAGVVSSLFSASLSGGSESANVPHHDLTLRRAIELALSSSAQITSMEALVARDTAQMDLSKSRFFPTVEANLAAGTVHEYRVDGIDTIVSTAPDDAAEKIEYNDYEGRVAFVWNLFRGFRDLTSLRESRINLERAEIQLQAVRSSILQQTILTYFGIERDQRKLDAELEIEKLRESQLRDIRSRQRSGRATDLETLQAQYELSQQKPAIRRIKASISQGKQKLIRLVGLELTVTLKLRDSMSEAVHAIEKQAQNVSLSELYKTALILSPVLLDLRAAEAGVEQERSRLLGQHLPSVDFVLEVRSRAQRLRDISEESSRRSSGMIQLNVPLFSGLSGLRERAVTYAQLRAVQAQQSYQREDLLLRLSDAYQQLDLAKGEIEAQEVNTNLADEAIKRADSLYGSGRITLTEVLRAYTDRINSSQLLADALFRRIEANVSLLHESGLLASRGWL